MSRKTIKCNQWHDAQKEVPDNARQVLVYAMNTHHVLAKYDKMRVGIGTEKEMWVTYDAYSPMVEVKNVIKWMDLPEPD